MYGKGILLQDPFSFVPIEKNPWGGQAIPNLKKRYFPKATIPDRVGESWEVLPQAGLPVLLKWLHAQDFLSVQVHPDNHNPQLKPHECGKPEAWLVVDLEPEAFLYLGFKKGLSQKEIEKYLLLDQADKCLYKYFPKKLDYISVPPGCVHAIGPGIFVMEPQCLVASKQGKTWRLSDWGRTYDVQGNLDPAGQSRELHTEEALSCIRWDLPRGEDLQGTLIRNLGSGDKFLGDLWNPFALQIFSGAGFGGNYEPLIPGMPSFISVYQGCIRIGEQTLHGGQSAVLPDDYPAYPLKTSFYLDDPCIAFFSLNSKEC